MMITLLFAGSAFFLFYLFILRPFICNRRNLPPGSQGIPLIGETLQLLAAYKTDNPEPFIDTRIRKYGRIFTSNIFGEPTIFVADPDANRFVIQNEGKLFRRSYPSSISNLLGRHSLLLMQGNLHKKLHSLALSFGNSSFIKDHLLQDIDQFVMCNIESWDGRTIHLQDETKKITFELAVKQLMSIDPGDWIENLRKEYTLLIEGFFSIPLPLFFTKYGRALKARTNVAESLRSVVIRRMQENGKGNEMDMLSALLANEEGLSVEEIVDFLLALLVAGHETTATVMTIAIKYLSENPACLSRLKEEHDEIRRRNDDGFLSWSDYKSMHFTQFVINETLRMANIISGVFRRALCDVQMKGYTIPRGIRVFASFRAVHLDEEVYREARTFNPWRWDGSQQTASNGAVFTPFGGGPRLCPGYELARVEISVFLHRFITEFMWVVDEQDKVIFFPTTRTAKRFPITVRRRKATSEMG